MQDSTSQEDTLKHLEEAEELKLMGKHHEALRILEQLIVEDPSNISALEEIADNELSMENFDRAETAAMQAIELDHRSYTSYYILGFLHSQKGKWPQALTYLQKANTLKPNNVEILRCLGWALFNNDKRTQGIVTLERALNLDSENPLTLCDLGTAYLQSKNISKAKTLLMRTLDIDPKNVRAQKCVQIVEKLEQSIQTETRVRQVGKA